MASEYRRDPLSDRWVIIAPERAARPDQFREVAAGGRPVAACPFCRGHEAETPEPTSIYPARGEWQVRVVPNLFPAVEPVPASPARSSPDWQCLPGHGVHEVIIESPEHVTSLAELNDEQLHWTFTAYRDRLAQIARDPQLAYGLVFKNARAAGGASLEHVHSQLVASSQIPPVLLAEWQRARIFWENNGHCLFCELISRESERADRLVAEHEGMLAICPFASRFPYETWVLPREHEAHFHSTGPRRLRAAGELVRQIIQRLELVLDEPAYNYWIHTAPCHTADEASFHWHIEIAPRVTRLAGFELGAGSFINPVFPEDAARVLRDARGMPR